MDDPKLVRDMDRILLRVPDGMKQRLASRAKARGRSINNEVIAMIAASLDKTDDLAEIQLREEQRRVYRELDELRARQEYLRARREALNNELRARRGEDLVDYADPPTRRVRPDPQDG